MKETQKRADFEVSMHFLCTFAFIMKGLTGHLCALLVVCVWGCTFVSSKVLLNHGLMPADIFFYRFLMAYICLLAVSHRQLWAKTLRDELTMVGLGVMGGSLYFLCENMALIYSPSSNVSILVSSTPLLTAFVVGTFYKNERLNRRQILGSLIAFLGMAMIVLNGQLVLHLNPRGDLLALAAALTWAFYSLMMRMLMGRYKADFITRKVFFYGLLTIQPYYAFVSPLQHDISLLTTPIVAGNLLFLGLVASTGGYLLWNWVLSQLGVVKSTNYVYLQSLITMLFAAIVLGERITWMAIVGTIILILGMIAVEKKRVQPPNPLEGEKTTVKTKADDNDEDDEGNDNRNS